jgi:hypothetical protein
VGFYANGSSRFTGVELYNKDMTFLRQIAHALGHMDVTRDSTGAEVAVWANAADAQLQVPCEAGVTKIRLSDAKQTCVWKGNWNWHVAVHISAPDDSGWFFMETYAPSDPIPPSGWFPYTNEILQVKLDGTEIRRLAHHHSRPFNSYMYQPKVSTNRQGTKLVYASNFGLQSILGYPSGYSDAYMIDLAATGAGPSEPETGGGTSGSTPPETTPPPKSTPQPEAPPPATPTGPLTRIEQNAGAVAYTGAWNSNVRSVHSGGSAVLAMTAGHSATIAFEGTGASWIALSDRWSGIAKVYVDGALKGEVDTYSAQEKAQVKIYSVTNLPAGSHTLKIEVAGTRNSSSAGNWVWIDAFEVISSTVPTPPTEPPSPGPVAITWSNPVDLGGTSLATDGTGALSLGYAKILPDLGSTAPAGVVILGSRQNNTLVTEAGVPASPLITTGRIYAEKTGGINTGIAIVNPNSSPVTIAFHFTDGTGADTGSNSMQIPANGALGRFLNENPFFGPATFQGAFSFTASLPVSVITLRTLVNERGEFLVSTLPVVDTTAPTVTSTVYLSRFADGGGWATKVVLVNPTDTTLTGNVEFWGGTETAAGSPVSVSLTSGQSSSSFSYMIPRRSSRTFTTSGTRSAMVDGSVRIVPTGGTVSPVGTIIFSFKPAGVTVTEAGVPGIQGKAFRMYAEFSETIGTSFAIANVGATEGTVNFDLYRLDGSFVASTTKTLLANAHIAKSVNELFPTLTGSFKGVLRIHGGPASGMSVVSLRTRKNERNEYLITTTPATNEASAPVNAPEIFPRFINGMGWTTQLVLFSGSTGQTTRGSVQFFNEQGSPLNLVLR